MPLEFLIIQLGSCGLFEGLPADRIKYLLEKFPFQLHNYSKDQIIVSKGELWNELRIVVDGSVSAVLNDDAGKMLKVEDFQVGQSLAPAFLFTKDRSFPVVVIANSPAKILIIERSVLLQIFVEEQSIMVNYLTMVSEIVQTLTKKIRILTMKSLKAKLSFILLQESKRLKSNILNLRRQNLADFLGVERPSLSRTLSQLVDENIIEVNGREIKILDMEFLKKYVP